MGPKASELVTCHPRAEAWTLPAITAIPAEEQSREAEVEKGKRLSAGLRMGSRREEMQGKLRQEIEKLR